MRQLSRRHEEVLCQLFEGENLKGVSSTVEVTLKRLREFCSALVLLGSATTQVMDMVLPLGEQMSARLCAACRAQIGSKPSSVYSFQPPITAADFGDASQDM